jgi:hypothetical protein
MLLLHAVSNHYYAIWCCMQYTAKGAATGNCTQPHACCLLNNLVQQLLSPLVHASMYDSAEGVTTGSRQMQAHLPAACWTVLSEAAKVSYTKIIKTQTCTLDRYLIPLALVPIIGSALQSAMPHQPDTVIALFLTCQRT